MRYLFWLKSQACSINHIVIIYIKFNNNLDEFIISADIYSKILKIDPKNIDAICDLAYIYFMKLNRKQEGISMLMECLKDCKEERNKAKLQSKMHELYNQSSDLDEKQMFDVDGMGHNMEGGHNFLDDSEGD